MKMTLPQRMMTYLALSEEKILMNVKDIRLIVTLMMSALQAFKMNGDRKIKCKK